MQTRLALALVPLLLVAACGGASPEPKSADDAKTESAQKPPECDAIGAKMMAVDDRPQGQGPADEMRSLAGALDKLSTGLKDEPIETPDLRAAVSELSAEAQSFAGKVRDMSGTFDEMQGITVKLRAWEQNVTITANAFDATCSKSAKAECETLGQELQKIPRLEGEKFAEHAKALESFIGVMEKQKVKDAKLKADLGAMLSALKEGIPHMRRLSTLLEEPKKLDPAAAELKSKVNRVRVLCGLPPKD